MSKDVTVFRGSEKEGYPFLEAWASGQLACSQPKDPRESVGMSFLFFEQPQFHGKRWAFLATSSSLPGLLKSRRLPALCIAHVSWREITQMLNRPL